MNNDLQQFSEERLNRIIEGHSFPITQEVKVLARIALSAKQAKPVGYLFVSPDGGIAYSISNVEFEGVKLVGPIYSTPQPAHTEQVNSPMQPLHIDEFGTIRFKANAIVQHLLDVAKHVGVTMNTIAMEGFKPEDEMQFAQLIGYSLSGYGELSYVTDESYEQASAAAPKPESE